MNGRALARHRCLAQDCDQPCAALLQCPTCLKLGIQGSIFCSQECFQRDWPTHKLEHRSKRLYDPFPKSVYSGSLRAVYPLSDRRLIPSHIARPDYAAKGIPMPPDTCAPNRDRRAKPVVLDLAGQAAMRKVCRLAREVLDIAAASIRPGITTDAIDEIVHRACIDRDSYPSPLNYNFFPKSVCTSLNEVICHGIPDQRVLLDGDILNLDVSLYHGGYHADLNETYYVGDKARTNPDCVRVVETARQCLDRAIATVKPGALFRSYGNIIQAHAEAQGCSTIRSFCAHGINQAFHAVPDIPHYARNKAIGAAQPGMCFTLEPMIALGSYRDVCWPDNWTVTTRDGKLSAQFEHTLLVTETGVEVLTARLDDSPGGAEPFLQ